MKGAVNVNEMSIYSPIYVDVSALFRPLSRINTVSLRNLSITQSIFSSKNLIKLIHQ